VYLRFFLPIVFAVLVLGVASSLPEAEAHIEECIEDENSEVCLVTESDEDGITDTWTVDDINHLDGQELFICELVDVSEAQGFQPGCSGDPTNLSDFESIEGSFAGEGTFIMEFDDSDFPDLFITVVWELIGGLFGSSESTLEERITIENVHVNESVTHSYRFFQETDFDLADGSPDTFVSISPTFNLCTTRGFYSRVWSTYERHSLS